MISIKDVAEVCKVSPMTVSRALNNSNEISQSTRERILKVCEEMGYRPNSAARSLILNRTNMIGLLIPDITNQYYAYLSKGVSSYLEKQGYGLVLCNSDRNIANEDMYLDFLTQRRVDGVILIPLRDNAEDYRILEGRIPFVLVDNYVNNINVSFVGNDNFTGAKKIVFHMIEKGYQRIGMILSHKNSTASNDRLKGYLEALSANHIEVDEKIIIHSNATFEDGYSLTKNLLEQKVDSIFAINDTLAMGIIKYCYTSGIRIPEDLGVAGYDDIEQTTMLPIPLTTVHQRKHMLGNTAARILIDEIQKKSLPGQKVILQPELIIRKSLGE